MKLGPQRLDLLNKIAGMTIKIVRQGNERDKNLGVGLNHIRENLGKR